MSLEALRNLAKKVPVAVASGKASDKYDRISSLIFLSPEGFVEKRTKCCAYILMELDATTKASDPWFKEYDYAVYQVPCIKYAKNLADQEYDYSDPRLETVLKRSEKGEKDSTSYYGKFFGDINLTLYTDKPEVVEARIAKGQTYSGNAVFSKEKWAGKADAVVTQAPPSLAIQDAEALMQPTSELAETPY